MNDAATGAPVISAIHSAPTPMLGLTDLGDCSARRLRAELETFDLGFFEEVEDLKYSYAKLRREATRLAKKQARGCSREGASVP